MRYLVLSDIHANLTAFLAVLDDASPFDRIWCMGDVVGYGPDPNECIGLLTQYDHLCVLGNHDLAALGKLGVDDFNPDARRAALWTREQLTPSSVDYLQGLPERIEAEGALLVHGSPRQPVWEYISHAAVAAANFSCFTTSCCLIGHTHVPGIYEEARPDVPASVRTLMPELGQAFALGRSRFILNLGSVGQPRDGDARASYALFDPQERTITYRRVGYAFQETQARMRELKLPDRLIARLSYGW